MMKIKNKLILLNIVLIISVFLLSCAETPQCDEANDPNISIELSKIPFELRNANSMVEQIPLDFLDMNEIGNLFVLAATSNMILFTTISMETRNRGAQFVPHEVMFLYDIVRHELIAEIDMSGYDHVITDAVIFDNSIIYISTQMYGIDNIYFVNRYDISSGKTAIMRTIYSQCSFEPNLQRVDDGYLIFYADFELGVYVVEFVSYNQDTEILYSNSFESGMPFSPGHFQAFGSTFAFFESYNNNDYFFTGNISGEYQRIPLTKRVHDFSILAQGIVTSHPHPAVMSNITRYLEFMSFCGQTTARLDGFRILRTITNGSAILGWADWWCDYRRYQASSLMLITYADESLYAHIINFLGAGSSPHIVSINETTWLLVSSFVSIEQDIGIFKLKIL